jgi:hypothetical protein
MKRLVLVAAVLAGCSSEQMYNSAAGAREQQCTRTMSREEYERCMKTADRSYGEYDQLKKKP